MQQQPLEGVRVVEFATLIAGPTAGMFLSHFGADVVKIESPIGDPGRTLISRRGRPGDWAPSYIACNVGKRSIALDLSKPEGQKVALELIRESDVVIENRRPGSMKRLGLDPQEMVDATPGCIWVSITGFDYDGPDCSRPAVDLILQAESGIMGVTGEVGGGPLRVGFPICDGVAAHVVVESVLAAYIRRIRTGQGAWLRVSLLDAAVHIQSTNITEYLQTGVEPPREGNCSPFSAPADAIETADGVVVIAAYQPHHWKALCAVLGRPDLETAQKFRNAESRVKNRAAMLTELRAVLVERSSRYWVEALSAAGVMVGEVAGYGALTSRPELAANQRFVDVAAGNGSRYRTVAPPLPFGKPGGGEGPLVPSLGQHTHEILIALGYAQSEIDLLVRAGTAVVPA